MWSSSKADWMQSLLIRTDLTQKVCHLSLKPISFAGLHLDSQWMNDNKQLNIVTGKITQRTRQNQNCFCKRKYQNEFK